jgi:hypothetical protein
LRTPLPDFVLQLQALDRILSRASFQTAPSVPALPLSAREFLHQQINLRSTPPATGTSSIQQFQMLDAYVGLRYPIGNSVLDVKVLDWGLGDAAQECAIMFSDNAAPH